MFYWKSYKWQLYFRLDRKERLAIISLSYIYPHTDFSCYSLIIPLIQLKQNTNIPQFLCYEDNNRPKAWIECIFSVHTALAKPVTCHALWTKDSLLAFTIPSACRNKWRKAGTWPKLFQFIAVQLIYGILLLNYFFISVWSDGDTLATVSAAVNQTN